MPDKKYPPEIDTDAASIVDGIVYAVNTGSRSTAESILCGFAKKYYDMRSNASPDDKAEWALIKKDEINQLAMATFTDREKCSKILREVRTRKVSLDNEHLTVGMVAAYESGMLAERDRILSALYERDETGVIAMLKDTFSATYPEKILIGFDAADWKYIMESIHAANSALLQPEPDPAAVRICNRICNVIGTE